MKKKIVIHPQHIRQFAGAEGSTFCLVTNPDVVDRFRIEQSGGYKGYCVRTFSREEEFAALLQSLPEPAHVLVASPHCFVQSPSPDAIGMRQVVAMACNSTPADVPVIEHFLRIIERTDPAQLETFAQRFITAIESCDYMEIVDEVVGTRARFDHIDESYSWSQQAGPLTWGEQQIAPMGEISVLPIFIRDFDAQRRLAINGEICFRGHPILHSGTPSFLRSDQQRIYSKLAPLQQHPVIASVADGFITDVRPVGSGAKPVVEMFEAMFAVDSRFRIIWEIGFAINTFMEILPGNHAMNEVYGGTHGCLHWGLGLTPYTQYHLDMICPDTHVIGNHGERLLGTPQSARNDGVKAGVRGNVAQ